MSPLLAMLVTAMMAPTGESYQSTIVINDGELVLNVESIVTPSSKNPAPSGAAKATKSKKKKSSSKGSGPSGAGKTGKNKTKPSFVGPLIGERVDFGFGLGGIVLPQGSVVSITQPWAGFMSVEAAGFAPFPDEALLFDSGNILGDDLDLQTPGYHPTNTEPLGTLLVIAEDLIDVAPADGIVDVPDDSAFGGVLAFDFTGPTDVSSFQIVDIDNPGSEVRYFDGTTLITTIPIPNMGDNSVQTVAGAAGVTRMEIDIVGSAGVANLTLVPCIAHINFNETVTGVPMPLPAGLTMSGIGGFFNATLGFDILADSLVTGRPDKAIIFDTANPTGDDDDLATPGPGFGNTQGLRKILILAENDVDVLPSDGLVDDPDDDAFGGAMVFEWPATQVRFLGATVIDVDVNEVSFFEVFLSDGSGNSVIVPLVSLGGNSVQTLETDIGPTQRVELHLGGSGGLAEIVVCPTN